MQPYIISLLLIGQYVHLVSSFKQFTARVISDLWPWDGHVQFSADGHTGDLLVVPAEDLHRSRRQAAGEATLKDNADVTLRAAYS